MAKEDKCLWCKGYHRPAQCPFYLSKNVARARRAQVETPEGKPANATPKGGAQGDTAAKPSASSTPARGHSKKAASIETSGVAYERRAPRSQQSSQGVGGGPNCWPLAGSASVDGSTPCTET